MSRRCSSNSITGTGSSKTTTSITSGSDRTGGPSRPALSPLGGDGARLGARRGRRDRALQGHGERFAAHPAPLAQRGGQPADVVLLRAPALLLVAACRHRPARTTEPGSVHNGVAPARHHFLLHVPRR